MKNKGVIWCFSRKQIVTFLWIASRLYQSIIHLRNDGKYSACLGSVQIRLLKFGVLSETHYISQTMLIHIHTSPWFHHDGKISKDCLQHEKVWHIWNQIRKVANWAILTHTVSFPGRCVWSMPTFLSLLHSASSICAPSCFFFPYTVSCHHHWACRRRTFFVPVNFQLEIQPGHW